MKLDFDAKTSLYITLSGTVTVGQRTTTLTSTFEAWAVPEEGGRSSLRQLYIVIRDGEHAVETAEGFCAVLAAQKLGLPTSRENDLGESVLSKWVQVGSAWVKAGQRVAKLCPWHTEANESLKLVKFTRRTVAPAADPFADLESPDDAMESLRQGDDAPF